ncbi:lantibiotic ABC transporter [Paramagnetospirillum marisnigri]|uniref:Lantibiotic ABC transporter n=1 Tax=Paramagnetospirillum marisnigri TaxID=1285242 RepID=A0A178MTV1_9PROT|nr:peptidase domain-containing ABC transporter [Paramagnetospirillum marisnigri]OAN53688.1 lantibiotic ABC transporter [Paramagnetospirillum marisnigri]
MNPQHELAVAAATAPTTSIPPPGGRITWGQHVSEVELTEELAASGRLGGFHAVTDVAACILPLLTALNWTGNVVHIAESLPHFAEKLDLTDVLNVMANLGFTSRSLTIRPCELDLRLLPCLFVPDGDGMAMVLVEPARDGVVRAFDSATRTYVNVMTPQESGSVWLFKPLDETTRLQQEEAPRDYVGTITKRFFPMIGRMMVASMISNVLILATPIFIMSVYDQYLPSGSWGLLVALLGGVGLALAGDHAIRSLRSRMIAYVGARLDHLLGIAVFRRLMMLAPSYTEQANSNSQIARMRDFEMIREFFTGPLATSLAEAPFVFIFLILMAVLGGPLVFVPIGAVLLFLLLAWVVRPLVVDRANALARASSKRQEFLVESLSNPRIIKEAGASDVWYDRYRNLSADAVLKAHSSARTNAAVAAVSQGLVTAAGVTTLAWGVERVLGGTMTVGQLMASMMVVWWVLRPLQTGFSLATQIERVQSSIAQINRLMQLRPERVAAASIQSPPALKGRLSFNNVSLRYSPEADPALLGVSFQADPGDVVAVVGPNGSGKSSVLKLALGMYRPQTGAVLIDDIDIRQLDPLELRRIVAYVPQRAELFFGTITQNLRLVSPTASDDEIRWACDEAGVLEDILELPDGFNTRVGDARTDRLPTSLRQRLSLARAYLKRAPITLFDEPAATLDFVSDRQFMKTLERMRGHSTVLLVTHRPSHLKLADKIVVLIQGQVRMAGPASQVAGRLPPGLF